MSMPPLRMQHWLLFVVIAIAFFAWGGWLMRSTGSVEPLPGMVQWQQRILAPMADGKLSLEQLNAIEGGELWLKPRLDGPQLVFRSELEASGQRWKLEAILVLSPHERTSLMAATGLKPTDPEQPLSSAMLGEMGQHALATLALRPEQPTAAEQITASFGPPRLRLQLNEGEGWVYPMQGLTAQIENDHVRLLHVVPKSTLTQ
ncbi:hypothetical protein [Pseudomonas turukhanskensis]|uniref:Uncharacterized protein n=1 Tax=Pseudomonas turukhanskensis TaxID=1806536 RepID=A0A9W6K1J6_9PSED|nr:hypothetical protein [Pseudomonas turukhanskensis]GLK87077.1 hypothetical protein GCM10017655_01390 [Pseudomonas turukhanskensis]